MTADEVEERFSEIQARLPALWKKHSHERAPRHVVGVPSLSLDLDGLPLPDGMIHFEERMFYLFNALGYPARHLTFLTSHIIPDEEISYYLHFLRNVPYSHARERLLMLAAGDRSNVPLTRKILDRPWLLERLRRRVDGDPNAYLTCYHSSRLEMELAVRLGIPILGTDPRHEGYGGKSFSRALFRELGLPHPVGRDGLRGVEDVASAMVDLVDSGELSPPAGKARVVLKQDFGVSGLGNRVLNLVSYWDLLSSSLPREEKVHRMESALRRHWGNAEGKAFLQRFHRLGGVVEVWTEGAPASAQVRITPLGEVQLVATHEEIVDARGEFQGCRMPYRGPQWPAVHRAALAVAESLASRGVCGRLDVDFLCSPDSLCLLDLNLRKGNTTNPLRTLGFLAGGGYSAESGIYTTAKAGDRFYYSSDKVSTRGGPPLLPQDVIDMVTYAGLHYSTSNHKGVVFHMLGGLSSGKLGITCVGDSPEEATATFERSMETLQTLVYNPAWL